jgi:hypothetical protein
MNFFCTYFDKGFIRRGLALFESLQEHCGDFRLYALCFDDCTLEALKKYGSNRLHPVSLEELLQADKQLAEVRSNRNTVEFYFTTTPALPLYLMNQHSEIDYITYLDADLFFYNSPNEIFAEIGSASITIIEHRYAAHLKGYEKNGIYNVSWVGFRRDVNGLNALKWWREKCLDWCYDRHEDGKYADQKYLDDWPERFSNVHVIRHLGANLAPWNLSSHRLSSDAGTIKVEGYPLIFFHFHGFRKILPNVYDPNLSSYGVKLTEIIRTKIYQPYIEGLESFRDYHPLEYRLRGNGIRLWIKK